MRQIAVLASLILLVALPVSAQSKYPKNEVYMGYSYQASASGSLQDEIAQGWSANWSNNFHRFVGLTTDFGGEYGNAQQLAQAFFGSYNALSGPRFTFRVNRVTLFTHALFGVILTQVSGYTDPIFGTFVPSQSDANFAMSYGGGLDLHALGPLGVRLVQFDHIPVRVDGGWVRNNRLRAGLVFKF